MLACLTTLYTLVSTSRGSETAVAPPLVGALDVPVDVERQAPRLPLTRATGCPRDRCSRPQRLRGPQPLYSARVRLDQQFEVAQPGCFAGLLSPTSMQAFFSVWHAIAI